MNNLSDAKPALAAAALHLYGESTRHITYSQMTNILVRLYGDGPDSGPLTMDGSKMDSILISILGEDGRDAAMISTLPEARGKISWYYDIQSGDGFLQAK